MLVFVLLVYCFGMKDILNSPTLYILFLFNKVSFFFYMYNKIYGFEALG